MNGSDIAAELRKSVCEDCGELCGDTVVARMGV